MTHTDKTILVAGATGQQGGSVARHLLRAGFKVRGLTRRPDSESSRALAALGAQMFQGDMLDRSSLDDAFEGVRGLFSVQDFYAADRGEEGEVEQGKNLLDAARDHHVEHVVQSTMARAVHAESVEHFRSKASIEKILKGSGLGHTMLGTVWFMDNLFNPKMGGLLSFAFLSTLLSRDTPFDMLAVDDIGRVATHVFLNPGEFVGERIELAGDRMTVSDMKARFREVVRKRPGPPLFIPKVFTRFLSPEFASQLRWQERQGWDFALPSERGFPVPMQTFEDFLRARCRG